MTLTHHTITVYHDDDWVEVDVSVSIYEEDDPPYSECLLISWKAKEYSPWLTEQMVDDEVQELFNDHQL